MPYKNREEYLAYQKGYYAGARAITIHHLGGRCAECGESRAKFLEIHHVIELNRRARSIIDLKNLDELELRCIKDHDRH